MASVARTCAVALVGLAACQDPPTEPRRVAARDPSLWQPPAVHWIAFMGYGQAPGNQIYKVRDDGTSLTQLTNYPVPAPLQEPFGALWSPAGPDRIAFVLMWDYSDSATTHAAVMKADGTGVLDLTPELKSAHSLAWSPDGSRLAFISGASLVVVNADGSGLDTIAYNPELRSPAWTPDGQRIGYFAGTDLDRTLVNDRGIYTVRPDGTGRTKILNVLLGGGSYADLHFSPDGKKLATCHELGNAKTLKVMNADGTGMTNMLLGCATSWLEQPEGPQWSPDGTRVLTVSNGDIYTVTIGNGSITQLSSGGDDSCARWSRQGTRIAYIHHEYSPSTQSADLALYVMSANGSLKKRVTPPGWLVRSHSWGP